MPAHDPHTLRGIPAPFAALVLGGLTLAFGLAGFIHLLRFFRVVDIPLTGLLFLATAWISLASRGKEACLPGLLLAALGFAIPLLALVLDRSHPWLA